MFSIKSFLTIVFALTCVAGHAKSARPKVIYGQDGRDDVDVSTKVQFQTLAKSTAGMFPKSFLQEADSQNFKLSHIRTIGENYNLCPGQRFREQPAAAACSGFLIGEDLLVTAGHCAHAGPMMPNPCEDFVWVFDYKMESGQKNEDLRFAKNNVYGCKEIVASAYAETGEDWAIIRLDRKVSARASLKLAATKPALEDELVIVGHPWGLPSKITSGSKVTDLPTNDLFFFTNADTFQGNSGSAVFNESTGEVVGILVGGRDDQTWYFKRGLDDNGNKVLKPLCSVVSNCKDDGTQCVSHYEVDESGEVFAALMDIDPKKTPMERVTLISLVQNHLDQL